MTFFEHNDPVCSENRVQAVSDGDDGPSLHEAAGGFFEQGFGLRVQAGGGFVKDQDGRILEESAGEGKSLCLPAAETRAAFADDRFVFLRQCFDEFMQVRGFGSFDHLFVMWRQACQGGYWLQWYRGKDMAFGGPRRWSLGNSVIRNLGYRG